MTTGEFIEWLAFAKIRTDHNGQSPELSLDERARQWNLDHGG